MKLLWMSISVALIMISVDAQRNSNFSKPVISLEKRPRPMTWLRPPEERRKLSIFPKNNAKFVVTPKPVAKSDETSTSGIPTKRPLMRKFDVHDKNEKGSWYFPPREPLMKTKRFTVTMAPQRLSVIDDSRYSLKSNDRMTAESKIIKTVTDKPNTRQEFNKVQVNKGNLIDLLRNKKLNVARPKSLAQIAKVDEKETGNKAANTEIRKNATFYNSTDVAPEIYGNLTEPSATLNESKIATTVKDNGDESSRIKNPLPPSNIEDILSESRSLELNGKSLNRYENNVLKLNKETLKENSTSSLTVLEKLMENILNGTTNSNDNPPPLHSDKEVNNDNMEDDVSQEMYMETKNVYQVKSINEKLGLNKNAETTEENIEEIISDLIQDFSIEKQTTDKDIVEEYTHEPFVSTTELEMTTQDHATSASDLRNEPQTEASTTIFLGNFRNVGTDSSFATTTTSLPAQSVSSLESVNKESLNNMEIINSVNIDEIVPVTDVSNELFVNISSENAVNKSLIGKSNKPTSDEISKGFHLVDDELSKESSINDSDLTEDTSNVSTMDNLNSEEISHDSNMAGEEISNESLRENSTFTEEISNESQIDKSNNYTDAVSNESFMASEAVSTESLSESNNNFTEETSNESNIDKSNNYTDEVSNESKLAGDNSNNFTEETSNELLIDKLNYTDEVSNDSNVSGENFTEEASNESLIENSNNYTDEVSNESNVAGDNSHNYTQETSNELLIENSNYTDDVSNDSTIDKRNNLTDEEISNESNMAGEVFSNESAENFNNFTEEILNSESIIDISLTTEDISGEAIMDKSNNLTGEDISFHKHSSKRNVPSRFKRSNNIIEEENLTTVSGLKYTGHELRLSHDLSFKNINA